ncbi:hypothetical protein TWF481_002693 [Arthrobotrys musiformis]|uniref:Uncharacterized protein n=1 Tax=Arthrobotrys musiformis TaxID=47236 RepID=A0AAV9VR29_9PEZI
MSRKTLWLRSKTEAHIYSLEDVDQLCKPAALGRIFRILWVQFSPILRNHSKRVEDLVRENERLRLEISSTKAEQTKQSSEHKLTAKELESLREEVNHEVKNAALARKEKEVVILRRVIKGREVIWTQERQKYKQTIRLLRDELESQNLAHDACGDEYDEEEEEELVKLAKMLSREREKKRNTNTTKPRIKRSWLEEEESTEEVEDKKPERPLQQYTKIRHSEVAAVVEPINSNKTVELIGIKHGRNQSSNTETVDSANKIPDRQIEQNGVPSTQEEATEASDSAERPTKRTRRQIEHGSNRNARCSSVSSSPTTSYQYPAKTKQRDQSLSNFKHGRGLLVSDEKIREQMEGLLF